MLKYHNAMVVFEEIPDEITIAINITNCPCKCKGCHSKFLWEDNGIELTFDELSNIIDKNKGVTCVCFMGGDSNPEEIDKFARFVHEERGLLVGWYSGRDKISELIDVRNFDFIKIGHYDEKLGGLNYASTNQIMYKVEHYKEGFDLTNITERFWKKKI